MNAPFDYNTCIEIFYFLNKLESTILWEFA